MTRARSIDLTLFLLFSIFPDQCTAVALSSASDVSEPSLHTDFEPHSNQATCSTAARMLANNNQVSGDLAIKDEEPCEVSEIEMANMLAGGGGMDAEPDEKLETNTAQYGEDIDAERVLDRLTAHASCVINWLVL